MEKSRKFESVNMDSCREPCPELLPAVNPAANSFLVKYRTSWPASCRELTGQPPAVNSCREPLSRTHAVRTQEGFVLVGTPPGYSSSDSVVRAGFLDFWNLRV